LPFLVLALLIAPSPAGAQSLPWFTGVGDLAGGSVESVALALAADGSVVVGHSQSTYGPEAFRWTTLLMLLRARELRLISVWHPSFLALLFEPLPLWWDGLLDDLVALDQR